MKRVNRSAAPERRDSTTMWRVAALVLTGALTYANSLSGPFVFDDRGSVIDNPTIERLWSLDVLSAPQETPVAGRPVANISFAVNYAIGGRDVFGYHIGNIALHLLCALLVYAIVRRTLQLTTGQMASTPPAAPGRRSPPRDDTRRSGIRSGTMARSRDRSITTPAFSVALIWAVHPLNSEVVDYLSQRTESLMAVFYLLTVYAAIRVMEGSRRTRWTALAVTACALGMASKESMVTAPLMVLVYDRVFVAGSFTRALRERRRLYAALAATWLVLAGLMLASPRTLSAGFTAHDADAWTYLLNQTVMITRYLRLSVWPRDLTLYYGWPLPLTLSDVWPQAVFILFLLALTVVALIRWPKAGFLGVWFFVALAPTSSVVPIATEVGAERRMYLPLIAIALLAVLAIERWRDRAIARWTALATVTLLLAAGTIARNREYRSSLRLAETTLERWPTPGGHSMLGTELAAAGRFEESEAHLRQAAPGHPPARYYLATVLTRNGKPEEAIAEFREFIRLQPPALDQVHLARGLLADLYMKNQRLAEAIEQYRSMIAARPADRDATSLLATALVRQGAYAEAIEQYRLLLDEHPHDVQALGGLGVALASMGRMDEAIAAFRRAVELDPGNSHAQENLARAEALRRSSGPG